MASNFDLDTPLLQLSKHHFFTVRDACASVQVWGATDGGKSSGSGNTLRSAYLRAGFGGIVLVAKPEEVDAWQKAARAHGRSDSVIVFDETRGMNFIAHELARHGPKGVNNVIECLMQVLAFADHATGGKGGKDEFWTDTSRQVLSRTIPLIYAAHGTVTVAMVIDFVYSAATRAEQYSDEAWAKNSFAAQTLRRVAEDPRFAANEDVKHSARYWLEKYPAIPDKTRGNIVISLCTRLDRFIGGRLQRSFCDRTDVVPEMTFHGAIIIVAMPALTWNEDGIIGQMLMKYLWQRAVLSRNALAREHQERPVFLWADESQMFITEKDDEFLAVCRGSRACVVFLSQTVVSYHARLGQDKTHAAEGLVAKCATQIFHQNSCSRTNQYAAELIGRDWQRRRSGSVSEGVNYGKGMNMGSSRNYGETSGSSHGSGGFSSNSGSTSGSGDSHGDNVNKGHSENRTDGWQEGLEFLYEPRFFATQLKSGGKRNGNRVTAVWFRAGGNFVDGGRGNTLITGFQQ